MSGHAYFSGSVSSAWTEETSQKRRRKLPWKSTVKVGSKAQPGGGRGNRYKNLFSDPGRCRHLDASLTATC